MRTLFIIALILSTFTLVSAQKELAIGSKAPTFEATSNTGHKINLTELNKNKQLVLLFYRGQWCPHCNRQLNELQDSLKMIEDLGATVLAITPEKQEEIKKTLEKTNAAFNIIYDKDHKIMDSYQVTFALSKANNIKYKAWGIDINKASGNDDLALPIPATYIIGKDGKIKGSFYDEDYKRRMTVKEILEVLKQ
ncbi:peroxiredoxin family protein [Labilibacter marinus]|uniref:peroxiredoxin family protein n=1 Tax=Labilibacter marinus TaxID=1477105 RepID=UPI00082A7F7C|nr:peroxiredoxin family protein [Labilibacter marinus]